MTLPTNELPAMSLISERLRHVLRGAKVNPRDEYTKQSYPTAKRTAQKLDDTFDLVSFQMSDYDCLSALS